jgi:hypothetical protein
VSQRESPESQIGCGVGDAAQDVLDGLDELVDEDLAAFPVGVVASSLHYLTPSFTIFLF